MSYMEEFVDSVISLMINQLSGFEVEQGKFNIPLTVGDISIDIMTGDIVKPEGVYVNREQKLLLKECIREQIQRRDKELIKSLTAVIKGVLDEKS